MEERKAERIHGSTLECQKLNHAKKSIYLAQVGSFSCTKDRGPLNSVTRSQLTFAVERGIIENKLSAVRIHFSPHPSERVAHACSAELFTGTGTPHVTESGLGGLQGCQENLRRNELFRAQSVLAVNDSEVRYDPWIVSRKSLCSFHLRISVLPVDSTPGLRRCQALPRYW